ncbi:hypothetical protein JOF53_007180 [Crossiella equi]|uniref:Uncharacterized protein n=1 Tax=Crossiella equi TaxID=130796 RepID=A0ABS5AP18_9PSEU|nr:hypothetical protein [Crossiella equi]MBP2478308.1 hypothetical protein [Crossiella equi]
MLAGGAREIRRGRSPRRWITWSWLVLLCGLLVGFACLLLPSR